MKAFLTGIGGQDGSYLAELLLSKGYEVHGLVRRSSVPNTSRIDHLAERLTLHHGDLSDSTVIQKIVRSISPDEIYHLGAQSHVRLSFDIPEYTSDIDALGTLRLLEAAKDIKAKFYMASSSELFGRVVETPQTENTPFCPCSPYGIAKQFAYWTTVNYREMYGMFACNGILFNHESPRRGITFVSRKITKAVAAIHRGEQKKLVLGNLDAYRDWGYAPEYVAAMHLILQQKKPSDYVVATGVTHTIREFLEYVLSLANLSIDCVRIDENNIRPAETWELRGDTSKINSIGWEPTIRLKELADIMFSAAMERIAK